VDEGTTGDTTAMAVEDARKVLSHSCGVAHSSCRGYSNPGGVDQNEVEQVLSTP